MNKRTIWHLEVPPHLDQQLTEYIKKDAFKTKSEFIRAAVRDRLQEERRRYVCSGAAIPDAHAKKRRLDKNELH